jgi:hypothetical protein
VNDQTEVPDQMTASPPERRRVRSPLRHAAFTMVLPLLLYAVVRPHLSSDALALAVAGTVPVMATIVLARQRRALDILSLLSAVAFTLACLISVMSGGSALSLKLHEAVVTFTIGSVLLLAVFVRRPFPIGRLLRFPSATAEIDGTLGTVTGGFLVLHAVIHAVLALLLPTGGYLVASRLVSLAMIALALLTLASYRRHLQRGTPSQP